LLRTSSSSRIDQRCIGSYACPIQQGAMHLVSTRLADERHLGVSNQCRCESWNPYDSNMSSLASEHESTSHCRRAIPKAVTRLGKFHDGGEQALERMQLISPPMLPWQKFAQPRVYIYATSIHADRSSHQCSRALTISTAATPIPPSALFHL
jgi:hypothetical protein